MAILVLATVISMIIAPAFSALTCMDPSGKPVDWWYISKLPRLSSNNNPLIANGIGYLYQDINSQGTWSMPTTGINDTTNGAFAQTLNPMYNLINSFYVNSIYYALYNDEHPDGSYTEYYAHAKGVQAFDTDTGFWLIHSVPKCPGTTSISYPSSGQMYGQSMLCVSFNTNQTLNDIGVIMTYYEPSVYAYSMPATFAAAFPDLNNAIVNKGYIHNAPYNHLANLTSLGGQSFTSFGKSLDWGLDLYSDFVTPTLMTNMMVEGWVDGSGNMPSVCNATYQTMNIQATNQDGVAFTTTDDHSKWTVSTASASPWICVGDINREQGQTKRGGGTLCQWNTNIWQTYNSSVTAVESC